MSLSIPAKLLLLVAFGDLHIFMSLSVPAELLLLVAFRDLHIFMSLSIPAELLLLVAFGDFHAVFHGVFCDHGGAQGTLVVGLGSKSDFGIN
jgi:hypothetical protein